MNILNMDYRREADRLNSLTMVFDNYPEPGEVSQLARDGVYWDGQHIKCYFCSQHPHPTTRGIVGPHYAVNHLESCQRQILNQPLAPIDIPSYIIQYDYRRESDRLNSLNMVSDNYPEPGEVSQLARDGVYWDGQHIKCYFCSQHPHPTTRGIVGPHYAVNHLESCQRRFQNRPIGGDISLDLLLGRNRISSSNRPMMDVHGLDNAGTTKPF